MPSYVDVEIGLRNCGDDEDQYIETIRIVCKYGDEKKQQLERLIGERDYDRFLTDVHALKNNFATVGAMKLANRARNLEDRCKSGKHDGVVEDGLLLANDYGTFVDDLKKALKLIDKEDGLVAGDEEINHSFREIEACVKEGRFEDASDLFEVLAFFNLPNKTDEFVNEMRRCLIEEDRDGVIEIIEEYRKGSDSQTRV